MGREEGGCHPRSRCEDHMEYITRYDLPPYIAGRRSG